LNKNILENSLNFLESIIYYSSSILGDSKAIITIISCSLLLRFLLEICGQRWIKTVAHTSTIIILPITTFVITKIIAGNIALSLGMVGALSIVRFRNPVRSPIELTAYFGAITMGIAASVSEIYVIKFTIFIFFAALFLFIISYLWKKVLRKNFFISSFSEGNTLSTLEVTLSSNIDILDKSSLLKTKKVTDSVVSYLLASNDFEILKDLSTVINKNEKLIEYQLNE